MIISQNGAVDLIPEYNRALRPIFCVSEGDANSRTINLTVTSAGEVFNIPEGAEVYVAGKKQDNTIFTYQCAFSGYIVSFPIAEQMSAANGLVLCELQIVVAGDPLGSANFCYWVEPSPIANGSSSESDLNIFEQAIAALGGYEYLTSEVSVLSARMDQFARLPDGSLSTAADAELVDIRVEADGTTAATAGDAVREQVTRLKNNIDAIAANTELPLSGNWVLGSINTQTGQDTENNARIRTDGYIDISNCDSIKFVIASGYKYWWYLYDAEGTLLRQRQAWATSDTEINAVTIGAAVQMRIVMSNTSDTAASVDYAQYLTITGVSKLKALVDSTAETANSIDHTMGVDIEETVSDVQQHFYFAPFKQGDTLQVSVTWTFTGSGDKNVNIKDDTGAIIKVIYSQGVYRFELPRDSEYIIVTLAKVSTVTTFTATYSIKSGMTLTLDSMYSDYQHTYYVEKDGTGDFTRLTDAIREACQYMDSLIYVGDGTWDLIAELGDEIDDISSSNWGLYLGNRVHVIFSSNSKVTANYTGSNTNVLRYFSPFNTGKYGFTLENATIEASRCRYCVHDERGEETDHYECHYINCNMLMDNSNNEAWTTAQCIGGGLGRSAYIDIDGCVFDSNMWGGIVSYHNCAYANSKSNVNVHNSYFKRHGTFRFCWYGVSTEITTAYVSGCSFASAIVHRAENESSTVENTAIVEWNNIVRT